MWVAIGSAVIGVVGGAYNNSQRAKEAERQRDWESQQSGGLIDGVAGLYSDHQNRASQKDLQEMYQRRVDEYKQYENRLNMSYEDGGAGYLASDEYTALAGIEDNRLRRRGGAGGRNANTIDQDLLMQQHAQKGLGDYRAGLRDSMARTSPSQYNGFYTDAMTRQGNQGAGTFAGLDGMINGVRRGYDAWNNRPGGYQGGGSIDNFPGADTSGGYDLEDGYGSYNGGGDDYSSWGNIGAEGGY